jgi:hypothetical protein
MSQDEQHLRLLSIFHYVVGGMAGLFACFPVMHLVAGIVVIIMAANPQADNDAPPAIIGWIFVCVATAIMLTGWVLAVCILLAGRFLAKRTHYLYCLIMAGVECLFMPLGTVLGVFTIIVLDRDSVKQVFTAKTS